METRLLIPPPPLIYQVLLQWAANLTRKTAAIFNSFKQLSFCFIFTSDVDKPPFTWEEDQKEDKQNLSVVSSVSSAVDSLRSEWADYWLSKQGDSQRTAHRSSNRSAGVKDNTSSVFPPVLQDLVGAPSQLLSLVMTDTFVSVGPLRFSVCFSLTLSPPLPFWVLTERLLFQVQDISISTCWWSLFIQPSQHLRCDHSWPVNLPPWQRRSRQTQRLSEDVLSLSKILVCSHTNNCLLRCLEVCLCLLAYCSVLTSDMC